MKKILAMLLAFTMMIAMAIPVFADEVGGENNQPSIPTTGSITINGVSEDTETVYKIYKILSLKTFDTTKQIYEYELNGNNSPWDSFFRKGTDGNADGPGYEYIHEDNTGVLKWQKENSNDDIVAQFAQKALAYAKENNIAPYRSVKVSDMTFSDNDEIRKYVFSNLEWGYYLVDTSVGALCGLTTTNIKASVNAKNSIPTIEKHVMEDSTNQYDNHNTADIGQIVEYRITINVNAGVENYVVHDDMSEAMTFVQEKYVQDTDNKGNYIVPNTDLLNKPDANLILYPNNHPIQALRKAFRGVWRIEHVVPHSDGSISSVTEVNDNYYTIVIDDKKIGNGHRNDQGQVVIPNQETTPDGCEFEIYFNDDFSKHLKPNDKIVIYYNAMLNRAAEIAGEGNKNEAWLAFGDTGKTVKKEVHTYTYEFDIVKTDGQNDLLNGAEFRIYDSAEGGNEVGVVPLLGVNNNQIFDNKGNPKYRRARADEVLAGSCVPIVVKDGVTTLVGFDNGTYYLEETKKLDGYNKLEGRKSFTINNANMSAIFNNGIYSTGSGVHVVNHSGQMLPETGGAGTVMFIAGGMIVVLGAGVLLVTKKRMNMIK